MDEQYLEVITQAFPTSIPLEQLEVRHPEYDDIKDYLEKIELLIGPYHKLHKRADEFLRRRSDESDSLYQIRLDNFYTDPILKTSISKQADKFVSIPPMVSEVDHPWWSNVRENLNGCGLDEAGFLREVFTTTTKVGKVYALIEKPAIEAGVEVSSLAEEEELGLIPYVCLIHPLQVINWSKNYKREYQWLVIRQVEPVCLPFKEVFYKITWSLITTTHIVKYAAYAEMSSEGEVVNLLDNLGEPLNTVDNAVPLLGTPVEHGRDEIPIEELVFTDSNDGKWLCDLAYGLVLAQINVENGLLDTAVSAGYVQRTYTPPTLPDNDSGNTYEDYKQVFQDIMSSNAHLIMGEFDFKEITGGAITNVSAVLDKIKTSIKDLISLGAPSVEKGALQQSGASKAMDFVREEESLKGFGKLICAWYQKVLRKVANALGMPKEEYENISVTGLDSFNLDTLESLVGIAKSLKDSGVEDDLTLSTRRGLMAKIEASINTNFSPDQKEEVAREQAEYWEDYIKFLDSDKAELLMNMAGYQQLSKRTLLELYKYGGYLPEELDVEVELEKIALEQPSPNSPKEAITSDEEGVYRNRNRKRRKAPRMSNDDTRSDRNTSVDS